MLEAILEELELPARLKLVGITHGGCNLIVKLQPLVKLQPMTSPTERPWSPPGFRAEPAEGVDYISDDGTTIIEMKLGAQGLRDLHGAMMQLALYLQAHPGVTRGIVAVRFPRMTLPSARDAWNSAKALLAAKVRAKLEVVVLLPAEPYVWFEPDTPQLASLARAFAQQHGVPARAPVDASIPTSRKFFEAWKVLLYTWLRRERPLSGRDAAALSACSYPMMIRFAAFLRQRHELLPGDMSKLELRGFPRATFDQAVGLADGLRRTMWFVDVTGRLEPDVLLRRLQRTRPKDVGVGGAHAARRLDPSFDLHGTPRLDLTQWVPTRALGNLTFVAKLDPALRPSRTKDGAVLAVHRLSRAKPLFDNDRVLGSVADPVEVLLDLHELRLGAQAEALVKRLRGDS